jgi:two-component system response regulator RegA
MREGFTKLMVCDDDSAFRKRLAKSLRDRGYDVFEAVDASEGIEVFREYRPQGVIVDMRMPGESGLSLVRELNREAPGAVRIVMLTGFGSITTALEAVRLGAVNYLTKPTSVDAILAGFFPEEATSRACQSEIPSLAQVEEEYVNRVLAEHDGNVSQSAKVLGLARRSLQRRLRR